MNNSSLSSGSILGSPPIWSWPEYLQREALSRILIRCPNHLSIIIIIIILIVTQNSSSFKCMLTFHTLTWSVHSWCHLPVEFYHYLFSCYETKLINTLLWRECCRFIAQIIFQIKLFNFCFVTMRKMFTWWESSYTTKSYVESGSNVDRSWQSCKLQADWLL